MSKRTWTGEICEKIALLGVDVFGLCLAFFLASDYRELAQLANAPQRISVWLSYGTSSHFLGYFSATVVLLYWFWESGHYSRRLPFWDEQRQLLKLIVSAATLEAALLILLSEAPFERWAFIATWGCGVALIFAGRIMIKIAMIRLGFWQRPTIIVGTGSNAIRALHALSQERLMGYPVIGFGSLSDEPATPNRTISTPQGTLPIFSLGKTPIQILQQINHAHVVVALNSLSEFEGTVRLLSSGYKNLTLVPPLGGVPLYGMEISHFFSHDLLLMQVRNNLNRAGMQVLKRTFDLIISILLFILLWWLFLYFVWRIRRTGASAIYGHNRVGQGGKVFICYKFRTMVPDADHVLQQILSSDPKAAAEWAKDQKLRNDPRITAIGKLLRNTSLDELPQLWNVCRGDMSLVGPRPVMQDELQRYGEYASYYLETRPGITGLWQISGRNNTTYAERVALDVWYARNWSLWYDLVILLQTVGVVLNRKGAY